MPEGDHIREGILRGLYKYRASESGYAAAQLFGSGPMLNEALKAQQILAERYQIATDVWSVTSYSELRKDGLEVERWNRLHPAAGRACRIFRTSSPTRKARSLPRAII